MSGTGGRFSPSDFEGLWQIDRRIEDRRAGGTARMAGTARITPESGRWRYAETGTLVLDGGAELTSERVYLWQITPERVEVFFDDGRSFHAFTPDGRAERHLCDPDLYVPAYDFSDWPAWSVRWEVTGPRKDYGSFTRYRRG